MHTGTICLIVGLVALCLLIWPREDWLTTERRMRKRWCDENLQQALDDLRRAEFEQSKAAGRKARGE